MRKALIGLFVLTMAMSCAKTVESGYIGPSDIKVENGVMTPETLLALGRLSDPQLSPDGSKILYGVSYTSIPDNRSCRNLFICNTDGSGKTQLTRYASSVSNARWSKDGSKIYFIFKGQVWQAPFKGKSLGKMQKLSDIPAGVSGFSVSPDEANIIYVSSVRNTTLQQPSDSDPALDKAQAYATEDLMYRHWDHWVTEVPRSYVAPFGGELITPDNSFDILGTAELYELPTEPFGGIEQLAWAPDSRHIAYSCRKKTGKEYAFSTNSCIYITDIQSGQTLDVTTSGGYDTDPAWSADGKHLAWISMARDGYEADRQRLMVCDVELGDSVSIGAVHELSSTFDHDVTGPVWHGEEIFFSSLVSEGIQGIFCIDMSGEVQRVTGEDWWFDFDSPFAVLESDKGTTLLASYASLKFPTELVAVDITSDGTSYRQLSDENGHIISQLDDIRSESVLVEMPNSSQPSSVLG